MESRNRKRTNVLQFEQNANFHFLKHERLLEEGAYIDALVSLRKAIEKDERNVYYQFALADLYTELELYEESNLTLFHILKIAPDKKEECLFSMSCNFFGLRDFTKAKESFESYLSAYPDGELFEEAENFLEVMTLEYFEEETDYASLYKKADAGKAFLDNGQYTEAIVLFQEILEEHPGMVFVRNNISLAYYCIGEIQLAIRYGEESLIYDPGNIHAICNLVLFAIKSEDASRKEKYCRLLEKTQGMDAEEDLKIALTYAELGEVEKAYQLTIGITEEAPYDTHVLFTAGIAAANVGKYVEATAYFTDMIKLHPEDSIAYYYRSLLQGAIDHQLKLPLISYQYQVPEEEARVRLLYFQECLGAENAEVKAYWREDAYFRGLINWALESGNETLVKAALLLCAKIDGREIRRYLQDFLMRKNQADDVKNEILLALKRMDVPPPYVAYLSGKITKVHMGVVEEHENRLKPSNEKAVSLLIRAAIESEQKELIPAAMECFSKYIYAFPEIPVMRNAAAWAAAFLYIAAEKLEMEKKEMLFDVLEVEELACKRCMKKIKEVLK
ncbi:MAG: tetratricopeptide repeat protein [Christensenellaceae bacterium]|jgi:tetratricopeptide (TPR) repeat protein